MRSLRLSILAIAGAFGLFLVGGSATGNVIGAGTQDFGALSLIGVLLIGVSASLLVVEFRPRRAQGEELTLV